MGDDVIKILRCCGPCGARVVAVRLRQMTTGGCWPRKAPLANWIQAVHECCGVLERKGLVRCTNEAEGTAPLYDVTDAGRRLFDWLMGNLEMKIVRKISK